MTQPILSITIPTYNRTEYLRQTLNVLLPQVTANVEIVIFDNCSTDGTEEYIKSLGNAVHYIRQESNIGADLNVLSCLTQARGEYQWLLCDDDLPCSNAVSCILDAISTHDKPPLVYLRVIAGDQELSSYDSTPVQTKWTDYDANGFLTKTSFLLTFAPLIIVRRECLNLEFITRSVGTGLTPAALVLSTVGQYRRAIISDKPLLYGRGENSSGYDKITIFSKNLVRLIESCDSTWFARRVLYQTYNDNLAIVINPLLRTQPFPTAGFITVVRSSYRYSNLYRQVLRSLLWQLTKRYILRRK